MNPERGIRLFGQHTHYLGLEVAPADSETGSRIGGRPPEACNPRLGCPRCGGALSYYWTLELADQLENAAQLSILLCRDFTCLLESSASTRVPEPSSIRIVAHPASPRARAATETDSNIEPRGLRLTQEQSEPPAPTWPHEGSKVGGRPALIQKEGIALALDKAGLQFVCQWNELDFPRGMRIGNYPLAGGTLYLFGALAAARIDPTRLVAFWQRS